MARQKNSAPTAATVRGTKETSQTQFTANSPEKQEKIEDLSPKESKLIEAMHRMDDEQLNDTLNFLNFLLDKQRKDEPCKHAIEEWRQISPYWKKEQNRRRPEYHKY